MSAVSQEEIIRPIGPYVAPQTFTDDFINEQIALVEALPVFLADVLSNLDDEKLDTPYRDGGWSLRQVVHHIADSHTNAFIRFKLALTEDNPVIKPYIQNSFAETADSVDMPVSASLQLLTGLHARFTVLLKSMKREDFKRTYFHPEQRTNFTLEHVLGLYGWHGRHHSLQILNFCKSRGWK